MQGRERMIFLVEYSSTNVVFSIENLMAEIKYILGEI